MWKLFRYLKGLADLIDRKDAVAIKWGQTCHGQCNQETREQCPIREDCQTFGPLINLVGLPDPTGGVV